MHGHGENKISLRPAFCGRRRTQGTVPRPFFGKGAFPDSENTAEDVANRHPALNPFREVLGADFAVAVHCIDDGDPMHNGRRQGRVITPKTT